MPSRLPRQWRELMRTFVSRFFEHDITGSGHDLKLSFIWLLAFLAMPGVIMPILQAWAIVWNGHGVDAGWILIAQHQGVDALRIAARADKVLYLGYAFAASGAVAAMSWNSLLLDRRDTLILGSLPVRPAVIVGAKITALLAYVVAITASMNVLSALMFGSLLATGNTVGFALRGMMAHGIASIGIGAFIVMMIVALQSVALLIVGPRVFARLSAALQTSVIAAIAVTLFTLPLLSQQINATLIHAEGGRPWLLMTPPAWFLGLYECLLGGRVDDGLVSLARVAVLSLVIAAVTLVVAVPLAYGRLALNATGTSRRTPTRILHRIGILWPRVVGGPSHEVRAVVQFAMSTLLRVERHRFVLAAASGVAFAWTLPTLLTLASAIPPVPDRSVYALPFVIMLWLLVGFRIALSLPSDLPAAWIFALIAPTPLHARTAVRRIIAAVCIGPIVIATFVFDWRCWGPAFSLAHVAVLAVTSLLLVEVLFRSMNDLPCAVEWQPERANLRFWWPAYLLGFLVFTKAIPAMGLWASRAVPTTGLVVGVIFAIYFWMRHRSIRRVTPRPVRLYDVHDRHAPPTVRERITDVLRELPHWPAHAWQDAPFALRRLTNTPLFTAFAVATLAIGIGSTAATYSVLQSLTSAQLGFDEPSQVITVTRYSGGRNRPADLSWPDYTDLRDASIDLAGISAWTSVPSSVSVAGNAELVAVEGVSGGAFEVIGVHPSIGRTIQPEDDRDGAPPVAMIAHTLWRTQFNGSPTALGQTIHVGGRTFDVVGVLPPGFQGVAQQNLQRTSVWIPLTQTPSMFHTIGFQLDTNNRRHDWLRVVGRIAAGRDEDTVAEQIRTVAHRLDIAAPTTSNTRPDSRRHWSASRADRAINVQGPPIIGLLYASPPLLLLLIACSNIANLVLSRGVTRQHEMAVRQALGASRSRLIREQLIDSMLLAGAGAVGGVAVAGGALRFVAANIAHTLGTTPQNRIDTSLQPALIGAAIVAAAVTVVIAGLAPALPLTRSAFRRAFAASGAAAVPRWRGRANVIAAQVAISTGMLLVTSLFVRQLIAEFQHPARTSLENVGVAVVPLGSQQRDESGGRRAIERILDAAARRGRLTSAAAVSLSGRDLSTTVTAEASTLSKAFAGTGRGRTYTDVVIGTPSMFATLQLPIRSGRAFDERDGPGAAGVAVVGTRLARTLFGREDVVGERVLMKGRRRPDADADGIASLTIIGVTDDWTLRASNGDPGSLYVPLMQDYTGDLAILARASVDGATTAALIRQAVHDAEPDLAVAFSGSAAVAASQSTRLYGLFTGITSALALIAVTLAMAGLYGVLAHLMARRTREIGVRVALGATHRDIVTMVMRDGLRPVANGLAGGVFAAALLRLSFQPYFNKPISAVDGVALLLAAIPLLVAAWLACYLPARRAAGVQPTEALRHT